MSNFEYRKPILEKIAALRNSEVISYVTGDRPRMEAQISSDSIDVFIEHLDAIGHARKISLILYTGGGDIAAAWRLINQLLASCDELEVIVLSKALSAGTLISLGANAIAMCRYSVLGPIDPSVEHPLNPNMPDAPHVQTSVSVEEIRGYLNAAGERGDLDAASRAHIYVDLSDKVHPLVLGQIFRTEGQIRLMAKKLLRGQIRDEKVIDRIIEFLCVYSGSHDYTINWIEATELGLRIEGLSQEFYEQHTKRLLASYYDEFGMKVPFDFRNILGERAHADYEIPRAAIESLRAGSHQFLSSGTIVRTDSLQPEIPQVPHEVQARDIRRFDDWRIIS